VTVSSSNKASYVKHFLDEDHFWVDSEVDGA
jgi:hypothetical protein